MSGDMFTIEDADNDGLIKREVGKQLASVAKRNSQQLYQYFEKIAEHEGREPWEIFGDAVVKALNDEDYSKSIAQVEIDMSQVNSGQMRIEDAEFLQQVMEKLGLDEEDDDEDFIEDVVRKRIEGNFRSPLEPVRENMENRNKGKSSEVRRLQEKVDRLESQLNETGGEKKETEEEEESVSEIFGDDEEEATDEQVSEIFGDDDEETEVVEDTTPDGDLDLSGATTGVGDGSGEGLTGSDDGVEEDDS